MEAHAAAVSLISSRIGHFHSTRHPFRLYHGSTNSTRPASHDPTRIINTSSLSHILSITLRTHHSPPLAIVEPNVSMSTLVRATLVAGYLPLVVPEFPGITAGGAFSGTAAESSSFRHGYFDESVAWIEIVLADGRVLRASAKENEELFYGAAGACGTLGVVTCLGVKLVEVGERKWVEVEYRGVHSFREALGVLDEIGKDAERGKSDDEGGAGGVDFLDAVMFARDMGVVVTGRLSDGSDRITSRGEFNVTDGDDARSQSSAQPKQPSTLPIQRFSRWQDPWFYHHAHGQVSHKRNTHCPTCEFVPAGDPGEKSNRIELVPIYDYIFRYDRGCFWMGSYGWPSWVSTTLPGRLLFNHWSHTAINYAMMHHARRASSFIIQDLAIPRAGAQDFLEWSDKELSLYPLWLCPIAGDRDRDEGFGESGKVWAHRSPRPTETTPSGPAASTTSQPTRATAIINIGVWGAPTSSWPETQKNAGTAHEARIVTFNQAIERKVRQLGGLKWLYAQNWYTEEEFWGGVDGDEDGERKDEGSGKSAYDETTRVQSIYDKREYDDLRAKWGADGGNILNLWEKVGRKDRGRAVRDTVPDATAGTVADQRPTAWNYLTAVIKATIGSDHLLATKERKVTPT